MSNGVERESLHEALLKLGRTPLNRLDAALDHLLETSANALHVARVGCWTMMQDRRGVTLQRMYRRGVGFEQSETDLLAERYPRYFEALESTLALDANDARTDPRTAELCDPYLVPNDVHALLDVPVRVFGKPFGIICHEHTGTPRQWTETEVVYAAAVGMMASLAFEQAEYWRAEHAYERSRLYDPLTGLPLRALFLDRLLQATLSGDPCGVVLIDLDRFRLLNESAGHMRGDTVLVEVAQRLREAIPAAETLGRMGDDEFGLLLCGPDAAGAVERAARGIVQALARPFTFDDQSIALGAALGSAVFVADEDPDDFLRNAETALAVARRQGGARHVRYDPGLKRATVENLALTARLHRALAADEFRAVFQPIVSLKDARVLGFEALVRWHDRERGQLVLPGEFIPECERSGLIARVGRKVRMQALSVLQAWQRQGSPMSGLTLSVNASPMEFRASQFAEIVRAELDHAGVDGSRYGFEITEGFVLEAAPQVLATIRGLRALGASVGLDDFGTGYGFLTHLRELPVTTVKIDQSFTAGLPGDRTACAIVDALVHLAHGLGLSVVAEGVETAEQIAFLQRIDCDSAQGYWFSRGVPQEAITPTWIADLSARTLEALHAQVA